MKTKPLMVECPIHGSAQIHWHHIIPKWKGGETKDYNLLPLCRYCHYKLHRFDADMYRRGWIGLQEKVGDVGAYMRSLQEGVRSRLGDDAYRERMRKVRKGGPIG